MPYNSSESYSVRWENTVKEFETTLEKGTKGEPVWFIPGNRRALDELNYHRAHRIRYTKLAFDVARLVPDRQNVECLDVGTNHLCVMMKKVFGFHFSALDLNDDWRTPLALAGIPLYVCDLSKAQVPLADGVYDLILFAEVLEHLPMNPRPILAEFYRILKPGGALLMTTPNFASLENRVALLRGQNPQEMIREREPAGSHFREWIMSECVSLLHNVGFEFVEARYDMVCDEFRRWRGCLIRKIIPSFRRGMTFVAKKASREACNQ